MSVAIIDYGSGNLHSAAKAFERAARGMDVPEKIVLGIQIIWFDRDEPHE